MNGYIAIYKGKQYEVFAETSLKARDKIALQLKAKKTYEVSVYLCEKNGKAIIQSSI